MDVSRINCHEVVIVQDQSAAVTQNAWFGWHTVNINTNRGRVLGKVSCTKNLPM